MKKNSEILSEETFQKPLFNDFNVLYVTKPINELTKNKRGANEMISVINKPSTICSRLLNGMYDPCTHKIYRGENIYFLVGVPFEIQESDLMVFEK